AGEGIRANALNPAAIATALQQHTGGLQTPKERRKTVQQGAATSVLLAASPLLDKVGGRYFEDCNEAATVTRRPADYAGVAWSPSTQRTRNGCGTPRSACCRPSPAAPVPLPVPPGVWGDGA